MAELIRQRAVASVGPIGVVTPYGSMAKARAAEAAADEWGRLRGRYFSDVMNDLAEENANKITDLQLKAQENWNEQFLYYADRENGAEDFGNYMRNHQEAMVSGLPEGIRDDANLVLSRMRVDNDFRVKMRAYEEARRLERVTMAATADRAVIDFSQLVQKVYLENDEDPNAISELTNAEIEDYTKDLPEEFRLAADLDMRRAINRATLAAAENAKAAELERAKSAFSLRTDAAVTHITSMVTQGASMNDVKFATDELKLRYLSQVGGVYDTEADAIDAWGLQAANVNALVLGREARAMIERGDKTGADQLILDFMSGYPTGVPNFGGWEPFSPELGHVVNSAAMIANRTFSIWDDRYGTDSGSNPQTASEKIAYSNFMDVVNEDPDLAALQLEEVAANTRMTADQYKTAHTTIVKNQELLALADGVFTSSDPERLTAFAAAFANLSAEDRTKAMSFFEKKNDLETGDLLSDPTKVNTSLYYAKTTGEVPPSLSKFFDRFKSMNLDDLDDPDRVLPFMAAWRGARNSLSAGLYEKVIGNNGAFFEGIAEQAGDGPTWDSAQVLQAARNVLSVTPPSTAVERRVEYFTKLLDAEETGEVGEVSISSIINEQHIANQMQGRLLDAAFRWNTENISDLFSFDTTTGTVTLINKPELYAAIPNVFTNQDDWDAGIFTAIGGMIDQVGMNVTTPWVARQFIDDPLLPQPGTDSWNDWVQSTVLAAQANPGATDRGVLLKAMENFANRGWAPSNFTLEAIQRRNSGETGVTLAQNGFEQTVISRGGNVGVALAEVAMLSVGYQRAWGEDAKSNIDFVDALQDNRIYFQPTPDGSGHVVWYVPRGDQEDVAPFMLLGGNPYVFQQSYDDYFAKIGFDAAQKVGLESDLLGGAYAAISQWRARGDVESQVMGRYLLNPNTYQALRLGQQPLGVDEPLLDFRNAPENLNPLSVEE